MKIIWAMSLIVCMNNHSSEWKSIFQNDDERVLPLKEQAIPIATEEFIANMNLVKEPGIPNIDNMETVEYIKSVAQYFDLEEVYD